MKKIYILLLIAASLLSHNLYAQISVTATAGTPGPTAYTTLKDAFDAINAGTHQGAITISIIGNTAEAAPAVLNSTGAGSAVYSSVLIKPTSAATISGATATGRGVIELNGADNVTIDGAIAAGGITRDLTVTNTAGNTIRFSMAVRIAVTDPGVTDANGITIKNLNVNGNATDRNTPGITSPITSVYQSFGIYAGGRASGATTEPFAINSTTNFAGIGTTMNGLVISNNAVNAAARGIAVQAANPGVINNLTVSNNVIGAATAGNTTTVYSIGMTLQGFAAATVSGNTIRNIESYVSENIAAMDFGIVSALGTNAIVEKNIIAGMNSRSNQGYGVNGIQVNLSSPSNSTFRNNFIYGLLKDMNGTGGFTTDFNLNGIKIYGGDTYKVYNNSVHLSGALTGPASTQLTSCLTITGTTLNPIDVRNNIFSNVLTGGTASSAHVSIYLPAFANSAMDLTINNNAYYSGGTAGTQGIAQAGTPYASPVITTGRGLYEAGNFNAASVTPVTNLRNYTSTLSAAGTNDNASFAFTTPAPFVSNTDLHINAGVMPTFLESKGAAVGVTTDIDGQVRPGPSGSVNGGATAPDLGADEFDGVPQAVVPVTVEYFRGSKVTGANYLDWKVTCTGEPSVKLVLERSVDGRNFTAIQEQTATATRCLQGFNYTDATPLAGMNYYRLKTITPDGDFRYSVIVALLNKDKGFELISVAPNPVKTSAVLSITSTKGGKMNISVSDITGKVVMTQNLNIIAGNNPIEMKFASLPAGTYSLIAVNPENERKTVRFVKY